MADIIKRKTLPNGRGLFWQLLNVFKYPALYNYFNGETNSGSMFTLYWVTFRADTKSYPGQYEP